MMINTSDQFGRNAGRLWQTLEKHGALSKDQLQKNTQLRPYEIDIAIGWLAREGKISFENNMYQIGQANLIDIIGKNAGVIWESLHKQCESSISGLTKETQLPTHQIYEAVGWLAREDKLSFSTKE